MKTTIYYLFPVAMYKQTLEEAAIESCVIDRSIYNDEYQPYYLDGFKDGAEWQAKQSPWISVKERLPEKESLY